MEIKQKNITETEKDIINYINENKKEEYPKILEKDNRIEVILALSDIRQNIINWYPFKENSSILEIGADYGEVTQILCKKLSKVVALETLQEKRNAIIKRNEDKTNLKVIEKFEEINEKFDYITLIGIENITDKPQEILGELKKYLNPDGIILMAIDNKLGMQYFSKTNDEGENITNQKDKKLYTLKELEKQIKEAGYANFKTYYPMTDYKLTNVIFTDKKPLSKNNLSRNIIYNSEDTIRFYEQNGAYRELLEEDENIFKIFTNSFLIEIFNGDYKENEIRLVAFSNMRKPQYRIQTVMENDFVYKYPGSEISRKHLENIKENIDILRQSNLNSIDTYDEEKIISKYTENLTLDKVIMNLIKEQKQEEAIELIKRFKEELVNKLEKSEEKQNVFDKYKIEYQKGDLQNMSLVKHGLWDLIFQNCFYIDNEFYFYDQEWKEENIPVEFILYRAIKYFERLKKYISSDELYEIMGIDKQQIKIFDELDNKIQENIRDEITWKIHTQGKTMLDLKRDKLTDNHNINLLKMDNVQKENLIKQKDEEIQELRNQLNYIYNSKSWKITEPLRNIRKLGNKRN